MYPLRTSDRHPIDRSLRQCPRCSALQEARKKMEAEEKREIARLDEHLTKERVSSRPLSVERTQSLQIHLCSTEFNETSA